jgi:beta-mannosidase
VGGGDLRGSPHLRKAPYQWGWDWGPKLPPIGIWKDIRLKGYSSAKLENIHIRQIHTAEDVSLQVDVDICIWEQADFRSVVTITPPDGEGLVVEGAFQKRNDKTSTCRLLCPIVHPHLWWPNGCGSQALYSVEIALFNGDILIEQRKVQVGLRTLELRQQPDQWGQSFTFVVNGVPVFAKGANWIPSDSFPTRIKMETLEYLIHSAVDANMNMLRVWGGRYYPEEEFYNLCDRYGILLWQDFMFACGVYPAADEFAENVRVEAIEIVHRLRHHACLALWCGNNEMEQGWVDWGWNKPDDPANQRLKAGYDRMFHHLLPEVVAAEDPDHPYWPSSASSGTPFTDPNGQQCGDTHYWDVWRKRNPFTAYRQQFPRFMSEFGFQALPPFRTIQTFAPLDEQNMTSYVMEYHQRSSKGNSLIISQMADHFRMPKDFPSLVYLSMVLQEIGRAHV